MARNLNKISAIISVNSQQARQQLAGFAGDAKKYAKSLDSSFKSMTASVQRTFDKIWTEQQRVQRALQAGMQAGVDPGVLRMFGDTKKLEQEANKIAELRKRALGMQTMEGQVAANREVDKIAEAFTKLNDSLVRTGSISRRELRSLQAGIRGIAAGVGVIGEKDSRLGTANAIRDEFGRVGVDKYFESTALEQSIKRLEAYRNVLRLVRAESDGPLRNAFNNLAKAEAKVAKTDPTNKAALKAAKAEVERLRIEFEKLAASKARAQGGQARFLRTEGGIRNWVDRSAEGSINSQWGTRTGLAIQQLTFAFDDFNSATGGMDAKIRAMGNNISQFGLIAGGTAGLIGGVLLGAMAQLYASYLKQVDAANDSAAMTKYLTDAEQKLADARKRQADIMKSLREGMMEAGMTEEQKRRLESDRKGGELLEAAKDEFRASVMQEDPVLRTIGARIAQIEERMKNPDMGAAERAQMNKQLREQRAMLEARTASLMGARQNPLDALDRMVEWVNKQGGFTSEKFASLGPMVDKIRDAVAAGMSGTELDTLIRDLGAEQPWEGGPFPTPTFSIIRDFLDEMVASAQSNLSREKLLKSEELAGMVPVFDQGTDSLNRLIGDVSKEFEGMIPEQYIATIEDIREEMLFVEQQLADGAISAEKAAAEMERLNGEMANVSATARQTAMDIEGERKARSLLADLQIDAFNREQEAKKRFYNESEKFAVDRAMDSVREFNLGARQTDGVSDAEARAETEAMLIREFAPAIMQLMNAQSNALLQGINRQTMAIQDTSNAAGQAEYARLVSGEDSARNADLTELRRQSKLLEEIRDEARDEGII